MSFEGIGLGLGFGVNRMPLFIPKAFGQTRTTRSIIIIIIIWLPIYLVISWIIVTNPWLHQLILSGFLALLAFILGLLIFGTWCSLAGLIRWENQEGIRIVKQGNKFIALDQDEVYPPQPGNT